jgi:pimeloyl-ACP methyl ester carboxylesterase
MFKSTANRVRGSWGLMLAQMELDGPNPIPGIPTDVIAGELDYLTPPILSERIAAGLRAAGNLNGFVVLPGVGHESNVEASDTVNTHIRRLCDLVQRRAEVA